MTIEAELAERETVAQPGGLRRLAVRGGAWLVAGDAASQAMGLLKIVIVSRLLAPGDFGLLGIALLVQRCVEAFSDTGVMAALIQRQGKIDGWLDTAWSIQVLRGAAVTAILFALASPLAWFFNNQDAAGAIRCVALVTLLWGFVNPAVVHFRRDLRFGIDVIWRTAGPVAGLLTTVAAALWLRNAWALLIGLVAGRVVDVVASYAVHRYRPRFQLRWSEMRELMKFGRWISLSNMATFLETQMDSVVIGKFLGAVPLGFYQVAGQFASPAGRLGVHAQGVLFPTLSRMNGNEDRRRAFLASLEVIASVLLPAACFVHVAARPLVVIALGPSWEPAVVPLQGLIWAMTARAISSCASPLFLSMGKPSTLVATQIFKLAAIAVLLFPMLHRWGIGGVAAAVALASIFSTAIQLILAARYVGANLADMLSSQRAAAIASSLAAAGILLAPERSDLLSLVLVAVSLPGYCWVLQRVGKRFLAGILRASPQVPA